MPAREGLVARASRAVKTARSRLHTDLHQRMAGIEGQLARLSQVHEQVHRLQVRVDEIHGNTQRLGEIARHTYDEEPANRRRLAALRRSKEYELAFTEEEPLVTFIVPTHTSYETLRDVALPSILNQDYANVEVIVSGDCAPPETAAAIAAVDDPRVVYVNRTIRGPYVEDRARRWFAIGGPPFNDALAIARGRWISALGDDDAVRPNHTRDLLAAARENGWEHCYGRQQFNFAEGDPLTVGKFPPVRGEWGMQAALYHSGLRFFESELADAIYEEPSDWSKCRRMIRAGVRFGMIEAIVVDKNERRWRSAGEAGEGGVPEVD